MLRVGSSEQSKVFVLEYTLEKNNKVVDKKHTIA